jgi:chloramphenicol 3-O phosphotransferase
MIVAPVRSALTVLAGLDVLLVGVHCSAAELARRERTRGDREPGQAAYQLERVHAHGLYELECDTTSASPLVCALRIREFLAERSRRGAFDQLRERELGVS